ncbi:DNA polymerase III, delta subunit [Pustulibacterium marinum]|uniref:DNA polymerase III subunit delta n=1 Tax=Pustulibacterium marinum TaxID=1224947 RepID=A0A1I7GZN3_9FLAO|nr:DNA polymerase III subunit delta [Pustulibacterium marinum]SFU53899.1 DNA polymerase III, delta subunit [Pustulibacterium marinum]
MDEVKELVANIQKKQLSPIYILMGDEPYYIDKISDFIANNVLDEAERGFNQMVLYGRDVSVDDIVSNAKRYPMMADRQVVIVKEAQELSRTIDNLAAYAENPLESTVLVICYKYKTLDKRKKLYKAAKKTGIIFESKKMYEDKVADWIRKVLAGQKYSITPKASQMLVEFLGNDLGRISKELEKLQLILPKESQVTPEIIEENIGISKDFNNFELRKAIGDRDVVKATKIIHHFAQNPKDNPIIVTVSMLFLFFTQLLKYHGLNDHNPKSVASALKINPYFVKEYQVAARNYPMKKVSYAVATLREIDVQTKGVGSNADMADLLKELLVKVML